MNTFFEDQNQFQGNRTSPKIKIYIVSFMIENEHVHIGIVQL